MKTCIIISFVIFSITISYAQDYQKIENQIYDEFNKLQSFGIGDSFDKIDAQNQKITELLLNVFKKYPQSINYPFEKLGDLFLSITESENKKLRIFSWDDMTGGTGRTNINLYQYSFKNQNCFGIINHSGNIENIYNIYSNKNKDLYLVLSSGKLSNPLRGICAFSIDISSDCITRTDLEIFKTSKKSISKINLSYSTFENDDEANFIFEKDILSVPIVLKNGKITNRFLRYRLKNGIFYFEKK